ELLVFCTYDAPLLAPLFCSSNLFFSYFARRPLSYTLFPYTTLFRSVAARTQRGDEHVVHGADRRLEIALEHAVELVPLASRDSQRAVAVAVRQLVDHEVLLTGEHTARDLAADHELVGRLAVRATERTALVAIL